MTAPKLNIVGPVAWCDECLDDSGQDAYCTTQGCLFYEVMKPSGPLRTTILEMGGTIDPEGSPLAESMDDSEHDDEAEEWIKAEAYRKDRALRLAEIRRSDEALEYLTPRAIKADHAHDRYDDCREYPR